MAEKFGSKPHCIFYNASCKFSWHGNYLSRAASDADITSGSVTLTLTSADPVGECVSSSDQITVTLFESPTVNAGTDVAICSGSTITLSGAFGATATSASWSSSSSGTFSSASSLTAIYTPSQADITNGSVTLTLTTNDPAGPCGAVTDAMILTINQPATVNAGLDQQVCVNGSPTSLAGNITEGSTSGTWTTSGTGTFGNSPIFMDDQVMNAYKKISWSGVLGVGSFRELGKRSPLSLSFGLRVHYGLTTIEGVTPTGG